DPLPIPKALAPVPKPVVDTWNNPPGPGPGQQNSLRNKQHKLLPSRIGYPDPIVYKINVLLRTHKFTTSQVLPIDSDGNPARSSQPLGRRIEAGIKRTLPLSTIYGFNGTFPGPMINAEYGKPVLVRFENPLDETPLALDPQGLSHADHY